MSLIRQDFTLLTSLGTAVSGGQVYVCTQPANTGTLPPSPLASIFSDSAGDNAVTQPLITNGFGQADCYVAPGVYTFVYFSDVTQELVYVDQTVISTTQAAVSTGVPTGTVNGSNVTFTLPTTPTTVNQGVGCTMPLRMVLTERIRFPRGSCAPQKWRAAASSTSATKRDCVSSVS